MNNCKNVKMGGIIITIQGFFDDDFNVRTGNEPFTTKMVYAGEKEINAIEEQNQDYDALVLIALYRTIDLIKRKANIKDSAYIEYLKILKG